MLRGKWKNTVERNQDGVVFLDLNPEYSGWILDYLRPKKIQAPRFRSIGEVSKNQMNQEF